MLRTFRIINILIFAAVEFFSFVTIYNILNLNNRSFINITPKHKKTYVAMNLTKALYLYFVAFIFIYNVITYTNINYDLLANIGAMYVILDTIALFVVNNMQINTKIHHIVVHVLYGICFYYNFDTMYPFIGGIIFYTFFSSCAGIVNAIVALRVFKNKNIFMIKLSKICYVVYVTCCLFNWVIQLYLLTLMDIPTTIVYSSLLLLIIYDDIVLIKYLIEYSK